MDQEDIWSDNGDQIGPGAGDDSFVGGKVRRKRDPGRCYIKAGFQHVGYAKDGKLCFQILPVDMPKPEPYQGAQLRIAR